jgi:hypothetical protein
MKASALRGAKAIFLFSEIQRGKNSLKWADLAMHGFITRKFRV